MMTGIFYNGNLTKDSNKGITNIAYNSLSLPSTVTFSDGSTITYSYASDGTKLSLSNMKDDLGWVVLYTRAEGTSEPTAIDEVEMCDAVLRPYAVDGVIYVDGCEDFDVYTLHGMKLAPHSTLLPGVYVVKVGSSTAMVVVK